MIEIIKEASSVLKDLPDMAIWILVGILLYKVFFLGSIFSIIKLFLNKAFKSIDEHRKKPNEFKIGNHFINSKVLSDFMFIVESIKHTDYVHDSGIEWLKEAVREKKERENSTP